MKKKLEGIYLRLPVFLQNAILTLYGLNLLKNRYSGNYPKFFEQFSKHLTWDKDEIFAYQSAQISRFLNHAAQTVPYYRELFLYHKIDVNKISVPKDLHFIPLLEKEVVRSSPEKLKSEAFSSRNIHTIFTTGTTGSPLRIFCNADVRQRNYGFFNRWLKSVGIKFNAWRATFGGRIIVPTNQTNPPFWRTSYSQRNILFSSYHLTDINIPHYIKKLTLVKPNYIDSYPSSLFTLTKYAKQGGIKLTNITDGLITSAETLYSEMRETIEDAFKLPVYDQYGAAEMCVFIAQCHHGQYHIHSDYALIEFLREDGSAAYPGEEAEIVCTGFINPVMPLIRYRIGDRGILGGCRCPCGLPFPTVKKILGRMDDVISTPDGRKIGRLSPVLKGFPVKEAQFLQTELSSLTILIVKDKGFSEDTEKMIKNEMRKRLGHSMNFIFKYVDKIYRSPGGKLKAVISTI
jgi:phenylacetate-CoA ligase